MQNKLGEQIKLSVIMITYNQENYIEQSIMSVINQEVKFPFEILVGDDCSSDATVQVIKALQQRYQDKIKLVTHENNVGAARNIYDLMICAKGQYITRLEGDDYWEKTDEIQKSIEFLDENDEYIGISRGVKSFSEKSNKFVGKTVFKNGETVNLDQWLNGAGCGTCIYRNFYKDGKDYSLLYKAARMIGEIAEGFFVVSHGNIYHTSVCWEVKRCDRLPNCANFNSLFTSEQIFYETIGAYNAIKIEYPQYNFSQRIRPQIIDFFFSCFFRKTLIQYKKYIATYSKEDKRNFAISILLKFPKVYFERVIYKLENIKRLMGTVK